VLPSAAVWSTTSFAPAPAASIFVVPLVGAGPGSKVDFETLSFQVPIWGSAACADAVPASAAESTPTAAAERHARFRLVFTASSSSVAGDGFPGPLNACL
jgi:hypothetical protein